MSTTTAPAPDQSGGQAHHHRDHVAMGRRPTFEQLSPDAVYQAKRFLLDSIGCALGGYQQHDVVIALEVLSEIAGRARPRSSAAASRWTRFQPRSPTR